MSEPTLEQIAAQMPDSPFYCAVNQAVLAREIIALREAHVYLATYVGVSEESARDGLEGHRQDALESQARPFQESGELAVGREGEEIRELRDHYLRVMSSDNSSHWEAREKLTAERDAAIARADEAERERDDYRETCGRISAQCDELAESRVERNAEIERLRGALRKIVEIDGSDPAVLHVGAMFVAHKIALEALDGSGQHE